MQFAVSVVPRAVAIWLVPAGGSPTTYRSRTATTLLSEPYVWSSSNAHACWQLCNAGRGCSPWPGYATNGIGEYGWLRCNVSTWICVRIGGPPGAGGAGGLAVTEVKVAAVVAWLRGLPQHIASCLALPGVCRRGQTGSIHRMYKAARSTMRQRPCGRPWFLRSSPGARHQSRFQHPAI